MSVKLKAGWLKRFPNVVFVATKVSGSTYYLVWIEGVVYGKPKSRFTVDKELHKGEVPWIEYLGTNLEFTHTHLQVEDIGGYRKD